MESEMTSKNTKKKKKKDNIWANDKNTSRKVVSKIILLH